MQTAKFTLWTAPEHKDLLESVRYKKYPALRDRQKKEITSTFFGCDFCKELHPVPHSFVNVVCDPDSYIRSDDLIKCPDCPLPRGARILCSTSEAGVFYEQTFYVEENDNAYYPFAIFIHNTTYNYFLPVAPMYFSDAAGDMSHSIHTRYLHFRQIESSLFHILHEKLQDVS